MFPSDADALAHAEFVWRGEEFVIDRIVSLEAQIVRYKLLVRGIRRQRDDALAEIERLSRPSGEMS